MEDDAKILDHNISATLTKLTQLYTALTPVAVLLNHVRRYNVKNGTDLGDGQCIYDAYRGVCAHGYFITKAAAEILVDKLFPVYVVADKWEYFQEHFISVKALVPYPIGLAPASLSSSIDAMGARIKKVASGRNYKYYMKKCFRQLIFSIRSRPFIRIEYQEVSESDLH